MPRTPLTSYRLQLGPDLSFDGARAQLPYLHSLGITDLYLSPILAAAPGSTHGYDVIDHNRISEVIGGRAGLERLVAAAREFDMGIVLDIVPNHMAVPTPAYLNAPLWSVLAHGPESEYARWFDIDWSAGALLMPILGQPLQAALDAAEIVVEASSEAAGGGPVLRYYDHVLPIRAGTETLELMDLLEQQHYRLEFWKLGNSQLNYRRFFDVATLIAVRVEDPEVFAATHALVLELIADGLVDGLRVDHPDGLADPRGYFTRLHRATGGAWTVAEKILEPDEELSADWPVSGTTGYDGAWRIGQAQIDPGGSVALGMVMTDLTGDRPDGLDRLVEDSKREIATGSLAAELARLTKSIAALRPGPQQPEMIADCLRELVVACDRYRAYVVPGEPAPGLSRQLIQQMAQQAASRLPATHQPTLDLVTDLVLDRSAIPADDAARAEIVVRFQQICGAVMAKGVEDTTFYRWTHLTSLCEVGGAPAQFGIEVAELHRWAQAISRSHPASMTNGSTHDSKRGEDVRARMGVLSQLAVQWREHVAALRQVTAPFRPPLDGRTENLLWQTLAATWTEQGPLAVQRFTDYLIKASREAKGWTSWTEIDQAAEQSLAQFAAATLHHDAVARQMARWLELTAEPVRAATLVTKAVQLTMPGVADIYQGTETTTVALVDPDNRRPVDTAPLASVLARLDDGAAPSGLAEEKLQLVAAIARLRRERADSFVGAAAGYQPLVSSTAHALGFARTVAGWPSVVCIGTRLPVALRSSGGWSDHTVQVPQGRWTDIVSGANHDGGQRRLAPLLDRAPAVVLARTEETS
ncbi:MAG: malto-oligosyltrehalose synthase [Beutenbergiaceae bacterium]